MLGRRSSSLLPLLFGIVVLLFSGCVPTSEHPLVGDSDDWVDPTLVGTWRGFFDESDPVLFHVMAAARSGENAYPGGMDLIMVSGEKDPAERNDWAILYALATQIAGQNFLSIEYRMENGETIEGDMRGFHLFRYTLTPSGTLTLQGLDEEEVIRLIEEGDLPGNVKRNRWFTEVRLTASSEELTTFLENADLDILFTGQSGTFTRIEL